MPAGRPDITPPAVIAHADWGSDPRKRQVAVASLAADGPAADGLAADGPAADGLAPDGPAAGGARVRPTYRVVSLAAAPDSDRGGADLFDELTAGYPAGRSLVGFDFTIGLPRAYAAAVGVESFPAFLGLIGSAPWQEFEQVAERPAEISLHRPFYPQRPGGTSRSHLQQGLGLTAPELRRRGDGNDAETLFWTLGGKQAGKASLHGWRLLRQARARGADIALWPFDGSLPSLLAGPAQFVVVEAYPREFYRYVGAPPRSRWSKRRRDDRVLVTPALLEWAGSLGVSWDATILRRVTAGLSDGPVGEDEFDAVIGMLGMIGVVTGAIAAGVPSDDPAVVTVEGWILGRRAAEV